MENLKKITAFLKVNGFEQREERFVTEKCEVIITDYQITVKSGGKTHHLPINCSFYLFFGLLVYNRYVSVDFERSEPLK